jgi:MFS transporter, DHA1 family, inner membrane transport protein
MVCPLSKLRQLEGKGAPDQRASRPVSRRESIGFTIFCESGIRLETARTIHAAVEFHTTSSDLAIVTGESSPTPVVPRPAVNPAAAGAGITLGCVAVLMIGLQPLLLGALLEEHRLSVAQLTQAATLELLALGVVASALGAFAPRRHLRLLGGVGCLLLIVSNAGCLNSTGLSFVMWRGVSGCGGGILLWIAGGIIAFSQTPTRLSAIFVGAQAVFQGALAVVLPITLMPGMGANGGLAALAALSLASMPLLRWLPSALPDLARGTLGRGWIGAGACAGLLASFFFMAAIVGFWVFVGPLATAHHVTPAISRFADAWNLAAQIVGAVFATVLARRLARVVGTVLVTACAAVLVALVLMFAVPHDAPFFAALMLHGFVWSIGLSFYVPLLIRADPTRRGAMLLPGAQMLGGSAGPIITGWFATETYLTPVLISTALLVLITLGGTIVAAVHRPPAPVP